MVKKKGLKAWGKKKLAIPKMKLPVKKIKLRPLEEEMFTHGGYLHHPETKKPMLGWK